MTNQVYKYNRYIIPNRKGKESNTYQFPNKEQTAVYDTLNTDQTTKANLGEPYLSFSV